MVLQDNVLQDVLNRPRVRIITSYAAADNAHMTMQLQPLRIPAGWRIVWNTLHETDPTADQISEGFHGVMSIFTAIHEQGRFLIDVEWRPHNDPSGCFHVWLDYAPWERTEQGRRRKDVPVSYQNSERVRESQAASRLELVPTLEEWMERCHEWRHEAN